MKNTSPGSGYWDEMRMKIKMIIRKRVDIVERKDVVTIYRQLCATSAN